MLDAVENALWCLSELPGPRSRVSIRGNSLMRQPEAQRLAAYVQSLGINCNLQLRTYGHIGATLADAVLQAGLNYTTVVAPRIERILSCFPEAKRTTGTLQLVNCIGVHEFLTWRNPAKPDRFMRLLRLFKDEAIETEEDVRAWLVHDENCSTVAALHGIGPKTINYLQILVGHDSVAVDRHVRKFVNAAGIPLGSYDEIRIIVCDAAKILAVASSSLDAAIWGYMSALRNDARTTKDVGQPFVASVSTSR
jgi:hypothetical protein